VREGEFSVLIVGVGDVRAVIDGDLGAAIGATRYYEVLQLKTKIHWPNWKVYSCTDSIPGRPKSGRLACGGFVCTEAQLATHTTEHMARNAAHRARKYKAAG
jgi:hypothetical protein